MLVDNLWGEYGKGGVFIEKKDQLSVPAQKTLPVNNVYNMNDIATYFTLLVGIYFPSVTGESITPLKAQHVTLQPSIHYR